MTEDVTEGPRGFAVLLQQVDEGQLHTDASKELHRVTKELLEWARTYQRDAKGSLTLTIGLNVDPSGVVDVVGDIKAKVPAPRRQRSTMWITKGGNLSAENPRQQKLPLREVPAATTTPRDVADDRAARSV